MPPAVLPRQVDSEVQKTMGNPEGQHIDRIIDVPVNDATPGFLRSSTLTGSLMFPFDASTPGSHDQESSENHELDACAYRRVCHMSVSPREDRPS